MTQRMNQNIAQKHLICDAGLVQGSPLAIPAFSHYFASYERLDQDGVRLARWMGLPRGCSILTSR